MADDSDVDSSDSKQYDDLKGKLDPSPISLNGFRGFPEGSSYSSMPRVKKMLQTSPEVRFINPAIYAESLTHSDYGEEETVTAEDVTSVVVEVRCGDSGDLVDEISTLSIGHDEETPRGSAAGDVGDELAPDTYRCGRSENSGTSTLTLTNNSRSVTRLVRRCAINGSTENCEGRDAEDEFVRRFSSNGRRVVQFSSTSLSSSGYSDSNDRSGLSLARKIAHEEWVQNKERAAKLRGEIERRDEVNRRKEEEKIERERTERERKERESFLRWQERKKREETSRRLAVERELELQRRLKDVEDNAAVAKVIHLRQWARKKEEAFKAQQKERELKRKAIAEERKKRLEESSQAFQKWRESAKMRPRPATQGLLPHQRAKPSFVNPKPWQEILEDEIVESDKDLTIKKGHEQPKDNVRRTVVSNN